MAFRPNASVKGLDKVLRNLQKEVNKIEGRTAGGLIEAVSFLQEDMMVTSPTIPVDKGNLQASFFITAKGAKKEGMLFAGTHTSMKNKFKGSLKLQGELEVSQRQSVALARKKISKYPIGVGFGFGAFYASYVHEMENVEWTKTGSGRKFLQAGIKRNKQTMLIIIQRAAKIKL